ncbi:type 4a pilus biogenesis protein PilO [Thermodesulfobacteriota bacterium]
MKKINFSLKALDPVFEKIEKITKVQRILIYVGSFVLLVGPIVYFLYIPKFNKISEMESKLDTLQTQLVTAKRQAGQLKSWRAKYKKAQVAFARAKKALPQKKEIPKLLSSISASGQQAGLEFVLFKPAKERKKQFYAEIPVSIKVTGRYHDVASFFDKLSRLPRLVNVDNISLAPFKKGNQAGKESTLSTNCTAITYRFVESKPKPKKKPGKKKKK